MKHKAYCVASGVLFVCVSLTHFLRILYGLSIEISGVSVPMAVSWFGVIVPASLAIWAVQIARKTDGP